MCTYAVADAVAKKEADIDRILREQKEQLREIQEKKAFERQLQREEQDFQKKQEELIKVHKDRMALKYPGITSTIVTPAYPYHEPAKPVAGMAETEHMRSLRMNLDSQARARKRAKAREDLERQIQQEETEMAERYAKK